jgi:hypothetical protein
MPFMLSSLVRRKFNGGLFSLTWLGFRLLILDQTKLPQKEVYLELSRYQE